MISARGNSTAKRDAVSHDVQAEVGHVESQRQPWLRLMSRLTGSSDLPNRGLPNHHTIIQLIRNSLRWLMPPFQTASSLGAPTPEHPVMSEHELLGNAVSSGAYRRVLARAHEEVKLLSVTNNLYDPPPQSAQSATVAAWWPLRHTTLAAVMRVCDGC